MRRHAPEDQDGASLVEIVVAAGLVAVGLAALVATVPAAMRAVVVAGDVGVATSLARQTLDLARTYPRDRLCTLDTGARFEPVAGHGGFSRRVVVTPSDCAPGGTGPAAVTVVIRAERIGVDTTLTTIRAGEE
jgi:Tfp pilus assembly protein PilV